MSFIDVPTLFFCNILAQSLLSITLGLIYFARHTKGLTEWSLAGVAQVMGWLVMFGLNSTPALNWPVAMVCFAISFALMRINFLQFFKHPITWADYWAASLVICVIFLIPNLADAQYIALCTWVFGTQVALLVLDLFRSKRQLRSQRTRWVIVFCGSAMAAAFYIRGIALFSIAGLSPDLRESNPYSLGFLLTSFVAIVMSNMASLMMYEDRIWDESQRLAFIDPLTELKNRRALMDAAEREIASALRSGHSLTVMILDIDHFKKINDQLGHHAGDQALQLFAHTLMHVARQTDTVARYGGEEFCILLSNCQAESALQLASRLRDQLAETSLRFSAGVSEWTAGDKNIETVLARADAALYEAKKQGRNRVISYPANTDLTTQLPLT